MPGAEAANKSVLLVSPHPDDEIIGAGATILGLQAAGYNVINLAASLGKPEQYERRRAELTDACDRAGIQLVIPEEPAHISSGDDLVASQTYLTGLIKELLEEHRPDIVIAPSIHDNHHGHEVVARAARDSLLGRDGARLWMYNVWGELPHPNIYSPFDQTRLDKVLHVLDAYTGENARNDYRQLVLGRALLGPVLGTEKVFGFGSAAASSLPYAELLTEVIQVDGAWQEGQKRVLTPETILDMPSSPKSLDTWMNSPSPQQLHRDQA